MKRLLSIASLCIAILLSGCAITTDQDKVTSTKTIRAEDDTSKVINNVKTWPSQSAGKARVPPTSKEEGGKEIVNNEVKKDAPSDESKPAAKARLIVIGNTLALNPSDKATSHKRYDAYEKSLKAAKLPVLMNRDWFVANSAGYVAIKYWGVAGVMSKWMYAEVSREMKNKINFPSEIMSSTLGASTDLVVAEQKDVSGIWITRVLCAKKQKSFDACSDKYAKGLFRESDGKEVDANLELVENGEQIDLVTFKKIPKKFN
jgi:hypothetical protein